MSDKHDGGSDLPPVTNPDRIREVCANELFSIEVGGGFVKLVFGMRQMHESEKGKPPAMVRRVTNSLVLSAAAGDDLTKKLLTIGRAIQQHQMLTKKPDTKSN